MKIEIGDIIDTQVNRNVVVVDIKKNGEHDYSCPVDVVFYKNEGDEMPYSTRLDWCTLVKKGEKKMKYKGIEAYKALQDGKLLEFACKNEFIFSIGSDNLIKESKKGTGKWKYSEISMNFLMTNSFIEYKEPLKYKVGDEVWVKAKVIQVDEVNNDLPYRLDLGEDYTAWFDEKEVKGIDE